MYAFPHTLGEWLTTQSQSLYTYIIMQRTHNWTCTIWTSIDYKGVNRLNHLQAR